MRDLHLGLGGKERSERERSEKNLDGLGHISTLRTGRLSELIRALGSLDWCTIWTKS